MFPSLLKLTFAAQIWWYKLKINLSIPWFAVIKQNYLIIHVWSRLLHKLFPWGNNGVSYRFSCLSCSVGGAVCWTGNCFITFLDPYLPRCFLAKVMNTIFPVDKTVEKKTRSVPKITDSYCWNFQKFGPKSWNNRLLTFRLWEVCWLRLLPWNL